MALYNICETNDDNNYLLIKIKKFRNLEEIEKSGKYKYFGNKIFSTNKLDICRTLIKGTGDSVGDFLALTNDIKIRKNSTIAFDISCSVSNDSKLDIDKWKEICISFLENYFGKDNVRNVWLFNPKAIPGEKGQCFLTAFIIPIAEVDEKRTLKMSNYINNTKNISLFFDSFAKSLSPLNIKRGDKGYRKPRNICLPERTMKWTIERVLNEIPSTVAKPDDWKEMTLFEKYQWCNVQRNLQKWCKDAIQVFENKDGDITNFEFPDNLRNNYFSNSRLSELKYNKDYCGVWILVILSDSLVNRNAARFMEKVNFVVNEIGFLKENIYDYLSGIDLSFVEAMPKF